MTQNAGSGSAFESNVDPQDRLPAGYLSVGDPELGRGIQEPEESAVTVKWRHVEQQLTGLKGEQEGAHAPDILEETQLNQCCGSRCFRASRIRSISTRYGYGSGSFYHQAKIVRKTLIPTVLLLFYDFLSLKNNVNVSSKNLEKKIIFCCHLQGY